MTEIDRVTELCESAPGLEVGGGSLGQHNRFSQLGNAEPRSGQCARRVAILIFPALSCTERLFSANIFYGY